MKRLLNRFRNLPLIQRYPVIKQLVKFGIVGAVITVVDFAIYLGLTRSFQFWADHYLWANVIAFCLAATGSYILNRVWSFRNIHRNIPVQYAKFIFVASIGLLINETVLFVTVQQFNFFDLVGKGFAVFVTMFWNFGMNKVWTFRQGSLLHHGRVQESFAGLTSSPSERKEFEHGKV